MSDHIRPASPGEIDAIIRELLDDACEVPLLVRGEDGTTWVAGQRPLPSYQRDALRARFEYNPEVAWQGRGTRIPTDDDAVRATQARRAWTRQDAERLAGDQLVEGERMSLSESINKALKDHFRKVVEDED